MLKEKLEMVEQLADIEIATKLLKGKMDIISCHVSCHLTSHKQANQSKWFPCSRQFNTGPSCPYRIHSQHTHIGDSQNHKINPWDAHYDHLKCDMKPLDVTKIGMSCMM